jgi:hypothetical protein
MPRKPERTQLPALAPVTVGCGPFVYVNVFQADPPDPLGVGDYGIPNPSFGPVTTEDHGEIEFLLAFART